MSIALIWKPGVDYAVGQRVQWAGHELECRVGHRAPSAADEPWWAAGLSGPRLRERLHLWRVCYPPQHRMERDRRPTR